MTKAKILSIKEVKHSVVATLQKCTAAPAAKVANPKKVISKLYSNQPKAVKALLKHI